MIELIIHRAGDRFSFLGVLRVLDLICLKQHYIFHDIFCFRGLKEYLKLLALSSISFFITDFRFGGLGSSISYLLSVV